jgi:hypothetical protein
VQIEIVSIGITNSRWSIYPYSTPAVEWRSVLLFPSILFCFVIISFERSFTLRVHAARACTSTGRFDLAFAEVRGVESTHANKS